MYSFFIFTVISFDSFILAKHNPEKMSESCESLSDTVKWHTFLLSFLHFKTKSKISTVGENPDQRQRESCSRLVKKLPSDLTYFSNDVTQNIGSQYEKIRLSCKIECNEYLLDKLKGPEFEFVLNIVNNKFTEDPVEFGKNLKTLIVKGENINLNDVITISNLEKYSYIYIFALNSVYVGAKLDVKNYIPNIAIITPTYLYEVDLNEELSYSSSFKVFAIVEESISLREVVSNGKVDKIKLTNLGRGTKTFDDEHVYEVMTLYLDYIKENMNSDSNDFRKNHFGYIIEKMKKSNNFQSIYIRQLKSIVVTFKDIKKQSPIVEKEDYLSLIKRVSEYRIENLNCNKQYKGYLKAYHMLYAYIANEITCMMDDTLSCDLPADEEDYVAFISRYLRQLESPKETWYSESDVDSRLYYILREFIVHVNVKNIPENDVRSEYEDRITKYINETEEIRAMFIDATVKLINDFRTLEEREHQIIMNTTSLDPKIQRDILFEAAAKQDFLEEYKSLLRDANKHTVEVLKKYKYYKTYSKAFSFFKAALLTRIQYLQDHVKPGLESNLIIDVSQYLESLKKDLNTMYSQDGRINSINRYRDNYRKEINSKIEETFGLLKINLIPEFDRISESFNQNFDSLLQDVRNYENQTLQTQNELEEKKKELYNIYVTRMVCGAFRILGSILTYFGPWGMAAGMALGAVATGAEAAALHYLQSPDVQISSLPKSVAAISRRRKRKINDNSPAADSNLLAVKSNEADLNAEDKQLSSEVESRIIKKRSAAEEAAAPSPMSIAKDVLKEAKSMYSAYDSYNAEVKETDAKIELVKEQYRKLEAYGENIQEKIMPMMTGMTQQLKNETDQMAKLFKASLKVKSWYVSGKLDDAKVLLVSLTEGFEQQNNLTICVEKLSKVMSSVVNMFEMIQEYQEHLLLANYIADLNLPFTEKISLNDTDLSLRINELSKAVERNIIMQRYMEAKEAFKQFVFPLAEVYLNGRIAQDKLELDQDTLLEKATDEISDFSLALSSYKKSIQEQDRYFGMGEFSSEFTSTKPFYVWKSGKYYQKILRLLSGQEVYFNADITNSKLTEDAIKFNKIEFKLMANDPAKQADLDNILKSFQISATHFGESHYRYNNSIYIIQTNVEKIWYNFEVSPKTHEPVRASSSYVKIKKGDFMLSPYTQWKLQITNVTEKANFDDFAKFENIIDIELRGFGFYVDIDKARNESFRIDEHYLNKKNFKSQKRAKRSISENYVSNSATPRLHSPINYICNVIHDTIVNLAPIKYFFKLPIAGQEYHSSLSNEDFFNKDIGFKGIINSINNGKVFSTGTGNLSNIFINDDSNQSQDLNVGPFDFLNNQNLALLNFALHKYNKVKYDQTFMINNMMKNEVASGHGQKLAYSAHIPKIVE